MPRLCPWVLLCLLGLAAMAQFHCKDEQGQPIDFWMALKHPQTGDYHYYDASFTTRTLKRSALSMKDDLKRGALAQTLTQVYQHANESAFVMYNDEDDTGKSEGYRAHAKGVLMSGSQSGFWLIHSLPRFPNNASSRSGYMGLPDTTYGQSFLCISLHSREIEAVASQLLVYMPNVYDSGMIPSLYQQFPILRSVVFQRHQDPRKSSVKNIQSVGGRTFISFAKSRSWDKEL